MKSNRPQAIHYARPSGLQPLSPRLVAAQRLSPTAESVVGSFATSAEQTAQSEMTATLSPSETVSSAGRSHCTADLAITSDANMAWLLAITSDVCLTGHERTMTFVELGCGENHLAIERILNAVMSSRMALPVAIFDRLTRWLDGYASSLEEPRLRTLLDAIRAQQFQPVRSRTQGTQCGDGGYTAAPACRLSVARRRHV